jgi:hypothetical protein
MIVLRRLVVATVIIAALEGLKWIIAGSAPATKIFVSQFLLCAQVVVVIWLVITAILSAFGKGSSWVARFLPVILILLVISIDMWFNYLINRPARIPGGLLPSFTRYYDRFERNDLKFEPCTVYDSISGPRIIPGLRFAFGNIEYRNQYNINRESLRDNDGDLFGSQIICLGNTFTLGCGVEEEQTFAELLARRSQKTVVNMGVTDQRTEDQFDYLSAADTSVLEFLVLQLSYPDKFEQLISGRDAEPSAESYDEFELKRRQYGWSKEYFPGKYSVSILSDWIASTVSPKRNKLTISPAEYAKHVVDLLAKTKQGVRYKIIITQIDEYAKMNTGLVNSIDSILRLPQYDSLGRQVHTVDLSGVLKREDYYVLDKHLKAEGHEKVAGQLWNKLAELEK